ncbi:DUF433 domain-containing protein [Phytohabitans flavus]|uniref:DUF433 domain-containing protein n=1 Tax=Phytohabitans flavus TaxID=1076124 RepID=UPI0036387878
MAYRAKMAAALSGASVGQLARWRKGDKPLLVPEVSTDPILYSFRDLVALRSFTYLREKVSLQKIRKALGNLRELGGLDHLSQYKLVAHGVSSVVLVAPDGDHGVDLADRPGHHVTVLAIGDVLESFPFRDIEVPSLRRPQPRISVDPSVRRGTPVVAGTRVSYDLVAGLLRDGVPAEEVADYYPSVTAEAARDALAFADHVDGISQRAA